MAARPLAGRVALVTGANHGIAAAAATALAGLGADVAAAYLRVLPPPASLPEAYLAQRRPDAGAVLAAIEASGARAMGVEELGGDGITANVAHPPVTDTGWVTNEVIAWLCTDAARLVTGNILRLR